MFQQVTLYEEFKHCHILGIVSKNNGGNVKVKLLARTSDN